MLGELRPWWHSLSWLGREQRRRSVDVTMGDFGERQSKGAAQRRDERRKKKVLYSKPTNRRAVGCSRNGLDALHVSPWVIRSFYCDGTGQELHRACQKKRRTCVPHLRNVSKCRRLWVHRPVTGQNSCFPDTVVVAIVSTDVTLKENFQLRCYEDWRQRRNNDNFESL